MSTLVSKRDTQRSVPPPPNGSSFSSSVRASQAPPARPSQPPVARPSQPPPVARPSQPPPAARPSTRPPSLAVRPDMLVRAVESQRPPPSSAAPLVQKRKFGLPSARSLSRVALVLASFTALCIWFWPARAQVVSAVTGPAAEIVYATGTIEKENRIQIRVRPGGTVTQVLAQEGQVVTAGQVLAKLDNPKVVAEAKAAKTAWENGERRGHHVGTGPSSTSALELQNAEREYQNTKSLVASGTLPAKAGHDADVAIRKARSAFSQATGRDAKDSSDATVDSLEAAYKAAAAFESDLEVKAPFDGIVLQSLLKVGDSVAVGQEAFGFAKNGEPIAAVSVEEAAVGKIRPRIGDKPGSQAKVIVVALDRRVFTGEVIDVASEAERQLRTFRVKVKLTENAPELRSGMSVEANLISREHPQALLVPSEAIDRDAVWVVEGMRAHQKAVRVGIRDLQLSEIEAGLTPGARVLVRPESTLQDGMFIWAR